MVSGIAATEDEIEADLRADLQAEDSRIANTSPFSPFFVLLAAVFTKPVLYLRALVVETILPSLYVKTAAGTQLDTLAYGYDETRKPATKARGDLTFTRAGTTGDLAIPGGTIVESPPIEGVVYRMATLAEGTIPEGASEALIEAEAEAAGVAYNLGDGYYSILPVAVPGVIAVANAAGWLTTFGADTESDEAFRERLRLKWRRVSGWHTADTYRSLISDAIGIDLADVYFDLTAPRGPGSADAYIVSSSGIPNAGQVAAANAHINDDGNHGLGDDLQVKAMPALPVTVAVEITAAADATAAERTQLAADAEDLIRAAFRQSSAYPAVRRVAPFQRLSRSYYAGELHQALAPIEAVEWIGPLSDPEPGMELPTLTAITVSVL